MNGLRDLRSARSTLSQSFGLEVIFAHSDICSRSVSFCPGPIIVVIFRCFGIVLVEDEDEYDV